MSNNPFSDLIPSGEGSISPFDDLIERPQFASGLKKRMEEYKGLSPIEAASQYRKGWGETLGNIADIATDPSKLASTVGSVLGTVYEAAKHPGTAAENIGKYYYENPDIAATDIALIATPLKPGTADVSRLTRVAEEAPKQSLKQRAIGGIEGAKQSGRVFPPSQVTPVLDDIRSALKKMSYDPSTHRRVARGLSNMDRLLAKSSITPEMESQLETLGPKARARARLAIMESGEGHTFGDIHNAMINLRPAIKAEGTEGAMANMMQEKLDDYVFTLPQGPEFQKGIADYAQARKLDEIDAIKDRVEIATKRNKTRAGYAHNLALEVDKIAKNPKKLRLWTPDEQAYIKSIVKKGNLPQKIAGALGNFAPTGIGRIGIDAVLGHILGGFIPGGTLGLMTIGAVGRGIETSLARKRLSEFERVVEAGGREDQLSKVVSPSVVDHLKKTPITKQALDNWKKKTTKATTRALAIAIARATNKPNLVPRIEQEINQIEQTGDQQ